MTWPPRVWLAMGVAVVLVVLLIGAIPWYRQLPVAPGTRRLIVASVVLFLVVLLAAVVVLVPAYWN